MSRETPLIIVPALNEERTVGDVVRGAAALGYPVCVIDDGSRDDTATVARAAGATVLKLPLNLGVGGALRCGFRYAIASGHGVVVQVDGDGQHNPSDIPGLLDRMEQTQADMVVGSRFVRGNPEYTVHTGRRLVMNVLARCASAAVGSPITDATSGFRAIRDPLLTFFAGEYPVEYLGDTFEALVSAGRRGAHVVEHPINASNRQHGTPSTGVIASGWYVVRVLAATGLGEARAARQPLGRTAGDGETTDAAHAPR